ncbi:hypothetical protein LIER_22795 [Lithospermum erythrorhizon]|uniref:CCHC-type domain-containing protein n=1 Tax=Lithospermum erythrorhizon TaxID=34254 RepID=A0AAV3QXN8_LITER
MRGSVSHSYGKEPLNSKDIVARILDEEIRLNESGVVNSEPVLFIEKGKFGHSVECWNCDKKCHIKRHCKEEGIHAVNIEDALLMAEVTKGAHVVAKGQNTGTLYKVAAKGVLQKSFGVSKHMKRRGKRVSQPLNKVLVERRCSDQTPNINEWIKWEVKGKKRDLLTTNQTWRISKVPGRKIMKVWQVKKEHVTDLNVGKVQQGNGFGYDSLIAKLVTFNDVLGLEKKTLELISASVRVRG